MEWERRINEGLSIKDAKGDMVLIIVENIIENIVSIKLTKLIKGDINKRVAIRAFQHQIYISDLQMLLTVKNKKVIFTELESVKLNELDYQSKKKYAA